MKNNFIQYEYKDVNINDELDLQYLDALTYFGWHIDESKTSSEHLFILKRERTIMNKMELIRLERNLASCFREIRNLHTSIHSYATMISISVGLVGIVGAILAFYFYRLQYHFLMGLFIALALLGIGAAYPSYMQCYKKRDLKMNYLVDQKYDEIEEICKKASTFF